MKSIFAFFMVLFSFSIHAAGLSAERGFKVHTINGQEVENSTASAYDLKLGNNQIVFSFSGKLSTGKSSELLDTKPHIVTLAADENSQFELKLVSRKYNVVVSALEKNSAWFFVNNHNSEVEGLESVVLPAKEGFFPYADIPSLVADYNKKNKIYFSQGTMVDYQELEKATESKLNKLQSLYLDASPEERKQFRKWIVDIE